MSRLKWPKPGYVRVCLVTNGLYILYGKDYAGRCENNDLVVKHERYGLCAELRLPVTLRSGSNILIFSKSQLLYVTDPIGDHRDVDRSINA